MAKQLSADGYLFDFAEDVVDAFLFDSPDHHGGLPAMKAVDIIAELPDEYLFSELKTYDAARGGIEFRCPLWKDKTLIAERCPLAVNEIKRVQANVKRIAHDLRQKYCDTFLFRYAEDKVNKNVSYICVVEGCDSAQLLRLQEIMKGAIPKGIQPQMKWIRPIVKNVAVVNVATWNATAQLNQYGSCRLVAAG